MPAETSPIPLYHQVSTALRRRILDGALPPGSRMPTEDALSVEFGVSRATVRQAVGVLATDGLVSRQQGRGTFVLDSARDALARTFRGNLADLVAAGEAKRTHVRDMRIAHRTELSPLAQSRLDLDAPVGTVVRRVRMMDGDTLDYMVDHLPPAMGSFVSRRSLRDTGLLRLLEQHGVAIARAAQTVRAQLADRTVATLLAIPLGSAVLHVERVLRDADGVPVDFTESWYRGDRYAYDVTFDRDDGELTGRLA